MTTWLPSFDVARLLNVSPRRVRQLADAGKLTPRYRSRGRSARGIEIAASSLPESAQLKYFSSSAEGEEGEPVPEEIGQRYATARLDSVRARADLRFEAVESWKAFLADQTRHRLNVPRVASESWLDGFRESHPGLNVSLPSVQRWTKAFDETGSKDALIDRNDGRARLGRFDVAPDLLGYFNALYLRPTKPRVAMCWKLLKKIATVRGLPLPSYSSIWRYARTIPPMVKEYFRNPSKKRSALRPFVVRDYLSVRAMEMIQADDHQIDVAVRCGDPLCTVGHYPWITAWIDIRSRKVLAVDLHIEAGNWQTITQTLHRVFVSEGLPGWVYVDNGSPYIRAVGGWGVKHFDVNRQTSRLVEVAGFSEDALKRVVGSFGVQSIFSIEGNPQSKIIERWFLTLIEWLYAKFESFRGRLGERSERAEYLRTHPELLPTVGDLAFELQCAVEEYNDTPHRGAGMEGQTPNQVFDATRLPKRTPHKAALALAFWKERINTVQKNGIEFNRDGVKWWRLDPAAQAEYFGQKVIVRYSDEDLTELIICNAAGKFICLATPRERADYGRTPATALAIAAKQHDWKATVEEIYKHNPAAAKKLREIAPDEAAYRRLLEIRAVVPRQIAAGAESVVTSIDTFESHLAREVDAARERLAYNGPPLTNDDRRAAAEVHLPSIEDLGSIGREPLYALPPADDVDVSTQLAELAADRKRSEREALGYCTATEDCPMASDLDSPFCSQHRHELLGE